MAKATTSSSNSSSLSAPKSSTTMVPRSKNSSAAQKETVNEIKPLETTTTEKMTNNLAQEHLPPIALIATIMVCSGAIFVFGMRDFMSTGRNIAGSWDDALMDFTKSTQWFEDSKGWKSQMGGFSAVKSVTTDDNNMGGFFIRKLAGAAAMGVQLQKLLPFLVHPSGAQWAAGHFRTLMWTALAANVAIIAFLQSYMADLEAAGADKLLKGAMALLSFESGVFFFYLSMSRITKRLPAIAMPKGKTPSTLAGLIVARTVAIVSGFVTLIAGRDFFFPGAIINYFPRDDIYLEWTNAFLHSPPGGSPEAADQGLETPFFVGDKFIAQYAALNVLLMCLYKFVSALTRLGSDGSGEIKCRMIWAAQAIGDMFLLFLLRVFTPAAQSASLDLRWHLMAVAYETFILGLYGFM